MKQTTDAMLSKTVVKPVGEKSPGLIKKKKIKKRKKFTFMNTIMMLILLIYKIYLFK